MCSDRFSDLEVIVWHPDAAIVNNLSNKLESAGTKVQQFEDLDQLSIKLPKEHDCVFERCDRTRTTHCP